MAKRKQDGFPCTFEELRRILREYEKRLVQQTYSLEGAFNAKPIPGAFGSERATSASS